MNAARILFVAALIASTFFGKHTVAETIDSPEGTLLAQAAAAPGDWFSTLPAAKQADILWKENQEGKLSWDGGAGTPWASGNYSFGIVNSPVHSGTKAMRSTIDTSAGQSGVRWPQRGIPGGATTLPDQAYYSTWVYFPEVFDSDWYMLMQWKRESSTTWSDPVKSVNVDKVGNRLRLHLHDFVDSSGHYSEDGANVDTAPIDFPVGQWVHLEAFYDWAADKTGSVVVWQNGVEVLRQSNTITEYIYNCCSHPHQWSINAYGDGLNPNPHAMYLDDAAISKSRLSSPTGNSSLPGDFNHNGRVDAADYTVWRVGLGTIYTNADYTLWKTHFGQTLGTGSAALAAPARAIPEPCALSLVALASFGLLAPRTRRSF